MIKSYKVGADIVVTVNLIMTSTPAADTGVPGGEVSHHFFCRGGVQHVMNKWTKWDLTFWKNKGSKRFKNNNKGG